MRWKPALIAATLIGLLASWVGLPTVPAAPAAAAPQPVVSAPEDPSAVPQSQREKLLGKGWQGSSDRLLFLRGDQFGLSLFMAKESSGFAIATVATLSEPGIDTDRWIGNYCVTESGKFAVVVYGPRQMTNNPQTMQRGGYTAVVDLITGSVRKLQIRSTLAYFNPGCGRGESAILTQSRGDDQPGGGEAQTRLFKLSANTGALTPPVTLPGQITSAIPSRSAIIAAAGAQVVSISSAAKVTTLRQTQSVPFQLVADSADGVSFLDHDGENSSAKRIALSSSAKTTSSVEFARGPLTGLDLQRGRNGITLLVGKPSWLGALPPTVADATGGEVGTASELGHASLGPQGSAPAAKLSATAGGESPAMTPQTLTVNLRVRTSGQAVELKARPGIRLPAAAKTGRDPHPLLDLSAPVSADSGTRASVADSPNSTIDVNHTCAVPRNDPKSQVLQPTPRQVEWAANQAVTGNLTMTRPKNWNQSGLPSWTPQGSFPPKPLVGGGRVPTQVLLGLMSQESNLWQASNHALPGMSGNPLVGNFYGRNVYDDDRSNDWDINFSKADCGYGVTQITDGMRKAGYARPGEVLLSPTKQRAAALDYATNIAAGLQILQDKWNQTKSAGIIHSNGDPKYLENWFFAAWAYNSGFYPKSGTNPWGLGWLNNPANPIYKANRTPFARDASDAAHPQDWPYQEKVIGFASYSISTVDGPGFRAAWWVSETARNQSKPNINTFCTPKNNCFPGQSFTPNDPAVSGAAATPCAHKNSAGLYDLKCWWHDPVTFNNCAQGFCGNELLRFNSSYPEQPNGDRSKPNCQGGQLPQGALIIDDVPLSAAPISTPERPCSYVSPSAGSFTANFQPPAGTPTTGGYSAKVDFHQVGVGYGGHMWFAHTRTATGTDARLRAEGTWTLAQPSTAWARVMVHLPDIGAHTQQARYDIRPSGSGKVIRRVALQRTGKNGWISLGVVKLEGRASISLSNVTDDGRGVDDVAWDSVAFVPLPAKPKNFVVALGDSFSSGEGAATGDGINDYYPETNYGGDLPDNGGRNACHRSKNAWSRKTTLADNTAEGLGKRADRLDPSLDFQFHACSGAQTENILPKGVSNPFDRLGVGQYGELTQLDKGFLDANTTLVMLSIGGNDSRFADIIKKCILVDDCKNWSLSLKPPLGVEVPQQVNGPVKSSVVQVLKAIHNKAPNAKILLMGYPELFTAGGRSCDLRLDSDEVTWIDSVIRTTMRSMLSSTAKELSALGIQTTYADPVPDFQGKGICGAPQSINGIVLEQTRSDEGLPKPSNQSFHPNLNGTSLYANTAKRALAGG